MLVASVRLFSLYLKPGGSGCEKNPANIRLSTNQGIVSYLSLSHHIVGSNGHFLRMISRYVGSHEQVGQFPVYKTIIIFLIVIRIRKIER
jgi:hypothetical protein